MTNRKIVALILSLVLISTPLSTIKAAEIPSNEYVQTSNEDTLDLRLDTIVVHTDYEKDKIYVEREVLNDGSVKVTVKDKVTNEVLETLTEMDESTNARTYATKAVMRERQDGPVLLTFMMHFRVYSSGSFRQIEETLSSDFYISSSCPMILNNVNTSVVSMTGSYPTTRVSYLGTGIVTGSVTVEKSTGVVVEGGASFKIGDFVEAGFSVSIESSTTEIITYYLRKQAKIQGEYSVY